MTKMSAAVAFAFAATLLVAAPATAEQPIGWYGALDIGGNSKNDFVSLNDGKGSVIHPSIDGKTAVFSNLPAGHYVLVIEGKGLAASIYKYVPVRRPSGDVVRDNSETQAGSISVGGFFGGGSGRDDGQKGTPSHGSHSSSGGGVGIGLTFGGGNGNSGTPVTHQTVLIALLLPAVQQARELALKVDPSAPRDLYFGFDAPAGGTVRVQIGVPVLSGDVENGVTPMPHGNETWISGVGDDANPCSRTAPCRTAENDTGVRVAAGDVNGDGVPEAKAASGTVGMKGDLGWGWSIANVPISLTDGSGRTIGRLKTDEQGNVAFQNLAPGSYTAVIDRKGLQVAMAASGNGGTHNAQGVVHYEVTPMLGDMPVATQRPFGASIPLCSQGCADPHVVFTLSNHGGVRLRLTQVGPRETDVDHTLR